MKQLKPVDLLVISHHIPGKKTQFSLFSSLSGKYDEAIKYFSLELREAQSADLREDILYCHRFLGECYFAKNEFSTSEKHHLNFLSSAREFADDERTEQAYTCLTHTYWVWLSYLQDDVFYMILNVINFLEKYVNEV